MVTLLTSTAGTWFVQETVLLLGQETAGFSLSSTVMVCAQRSVFPQASSAWYVLEIVVGQVPLGTSPMCVTATVPPQLSLVVTLTSNTAGTWFVSAGNAGCQPPVMVACSVVSQVSVRFGSGWGRY
ncbi:MAG: hypothetical protein IPM98_18030 [Lewinellaceae bacterium]|nr:hypothetical protein [Lewinellaceae bacterium]